MGPGDRLPLRSSPRSPNSVFYDDPVADRTQVRFALCKREDVLTEAAQRLRKAFGG
ncbi:hypothetical protein [Streptomyces sp. NPDC020983]|uniref:hypothetical protein n=1 Tax=Streptomyces sp. NPDC020983 TaxID=3365106 RepID=UPI0037B4A23A